MGNFLKYNILILTIIGFVSCDADLLGFVASTSESIEKRTEYSLAQNEENGITSIVSNEEEYRLCIVGDLHIGTTANFTKVDAAVASSAAAIVVLGDITTGREKDYKTAAELFANSQSKIISLIGNHDLYFGGWKHFKRYFGASVYCFEVQTPTVRDLYICLDSGNGTLGIKQYDWLKNTLSAERGDYRHCFVCSHTNLFRADGSQSPSGNMPLEETYRLMNLFSKNNVQAVFTGHDHSREELVFNKVQYITLDALHDGAKNASYVLLTVNTDFSYQFINLK